MNLKVEKKNGALCISDDFDNTLYTRPDNVCVKLAKKRFMKWAEEGYDIFEMLSVNDQKKITKKLV